MSMRNRFLVVVAVGSFAVGCRGGGSKGETADLAVTGTPTGEVTGKVRVILNFSHPMIAKEKVGQPEVTPPVTFEPALSGRATWADDRTLVFEPSSSLPVSTKYTATVREGTKALGRHELAADLTFSFFTPPVTATLAVIGSTTRATKDQLVKISLDQEAAFAQISAHCAYVSKTQRVDIKLAPDSSAGPARTFAFVPSRDLAADTDWKVACRDGLRGTVGNLGTAAVVEEPFHTYGPLKFVGFEPKANDIIPDEKLQLSIAFSNPLAKPYQMKLTPPVRGFPERCYGLGDDPAGLACAVPLEPRTAYTLTIDPSQKDAFGQALGTPQEVAFRTTDAKPTISMESGYFVAELKRPVIPVWTRNVTSLELTTVEVTPTNFHELAPLIDWWNSAAVDFAKTKLTAKTKKLPIAGTKNTWGQHSLGAAELVGGAPGPGMYYVEIASTEIEREPFKDGGREKVLVNFTDIGVVSKLSPARGLVWATRLSTGKPLPGATVSVRDPKGVQTWTGTTDADGIAVLPGTDKLERNVPGARTEELEEERGELRIYVSQGADWTMVNPTRSGGLSPWNFNVSVDSDDGPARLRGFMHTDRGLYRPGDTVHVKGLARVTRLGEPLAPPGEGKKVKVEVEGPTGKTVIETAAKLSAFGGFWFDLDLPGDARLGDYTVRARLEHGTFTRTFTVEEYRPATFEVTGTLADKSVVRRGTLEGTIAASYLYGAPVRSGSVELTVHSRPRRVAFEQHPEFQFVDERRYDTYYGESEQSQTLVTEDHGTIDDKGNAAFALAVGPSEVSADADLLVRASVTAPSNEVINKTFTVPYFRSTRYFGIKSPGYFLDVGKPQKFQVMAVTPDGKPRDGTAKVTVTRRDWNCVWEDWGYRGSYQCKDKLETLLAKSVQLAGGRPADVEFTPTTGGDYWVVVEGETDKDEAAAAAMQVYAWGDGGGSWRSSDTLSFDIVADKKEYKPGDTATLLLKTDLAQATGLVTIERDGVIERRLFDLTPTQKSLAIPITAAHAPNVYVSVALVQGRMGDGPRGKPRMRMGLIDLAVRPQDNTLTVSVETDKKDYRPGAAVTATVKVTDASGKPVSAEVAITAADEGVLSLIGYETPNPIPTFYAPWGIAVTTATQLAYIRDVPPPNVERPATGGDAAGTLRSRFAATAVWSPGAVTNAAGVATVKFTAPDNLTAYRVMAVAADRGYRFGAADQRFTVSKPLQLHQALPRFVALDDTTTAGVIVHNETGVAGTATVKLGADPHLAVTGPTEQTVQLAKGARLPVLFALAGAQVGEATLAFTVTMNGESDGLEIKLPVQHPTPLREQVVASAASKEAASVSIQLPADAIAGSGEVAISVDPDGLAGVEDGLAELIHYPYGCLEQTTSKMIPMLAVRDLADSLAIDGLTGAKLDGFVTTAIAKIGRHQTPYGGFSLWPGGRPEAYYTAYALWGLHLAKQAGYRVDQSRIDDGLAYLRNDGKNPDASRPYYSEAGNLGAQAFALYVRAVLGDKDPQAIATLAANPKLTIYGKAYVARALAASVGAKDPAVTKLVGELAELAAAAAAAGKPIVESGDNLDWYMSSSLRTSSAVLMALVEIDPKRPAIKSLVELVMKNRRADRYLDTQENVYSLLALAQYAKTLTGPAPSVIVELDGKPLLSGALSGKQRIRVASAPMGAAGQLRIRPTGEVHYHVALRYRPTVASLAATSNGISIQQEYLDEAGKPKTSFTVGDVVVVRLSVATKGEANHLMISAPLPAGFEAINARFATVGPVVKQTEEWGTYREMRDDRVDFASEWASYGGYVHEFTMRATAVGSFAKPPAVATLMYQPEVSGHTAYERIEIKAK